MSAASESPSPHDTQAQYARQAQRYAESGLHRYGETLQTVRRLAAPQPGDTVLDLGTGAGFTAFALAPHAGLVVAADLTPEMLRQAARLAAERPPLGRLEWTVAAAERLPFGDRAFPVITCRYASHHFHDLPHALRELARVLRPGGRLVLCDVVAPETPGMTELMNDLERLRDPTHVWDYPLSRWRDHLLPAAGLEVREVIPGKNPQLFADWVLRAATPPEAVQRLLAMFEGAPAQARQAFQVTGRGEELRFSWDNATILATRR